MSKPPNLPSRSPSAVRYVIGLGGNLGDRTLALAEGLRALSGMGALLAVSSLYETDPVGGPPQGPYLNAAALLEAAVAPRRLLEALLVAERTLGRVRRERWAPRRIDLDLLWAGDLIVSEPDLEVPHPRLGERAFALVPLLEVVPDARDPRTGEPYAGVLAGLPPARVRRLGALAGTAAFSRDGAAPWGLGVEAARNP
ncbi:MAG TPA: 2-amino-4-hydroxy-6-hydroxymethyldihydropteridine diphosphokinase [Polyangiaceae bacterium]|nr:2-amino-4-hydroxy-6-hydroxymethyldihydropteridine diphosphokinase [Polyangiaceae bacterium]